MDLFNWKKTLMPYEQAVKELCVKFKGLAKEFAELEFHSPIEHVEGRVKSVASILEKANRKDIPYESIEENIEDIAGIRIMCRFVDDIDRVINLVRERDGLDIVILKERDYLKDIKQSGYRSYHIILKYRLITIEGKKDVNCEIQIRTLAMNLWATIEHSLKYKYNGNVPDELKQRLKIAAETAFNLDKEMGFIRSEILEAQKKFQIKNDIVDKILDNMQRLHYVAKLDDMNRLNRKFFEIYAEGDIDKLESFNDELDVVAQLYKVHKI